MLIAGAPCIGEAAQAGRSVAEVLRSMRDEGLQFIYSTALIPDDLVVRSEPLAQGGLPLVQEVLAQHGLELVRVAPGTFAVVRQRPSQRSTEPGRGEETNAKEEVAEIVVSTSRYSLSTNLVEPQALMTQQDISELPRLGDETLRAVQRLPGAATNGISGLAAIRGGEPSETLILLDGVQLFEPFHLKNFFSPISLLDSRMISRMEVYSGGFPADYGGRISAVIDAHSVRPSADRYFELGASLFHTNALASIRFDEGNGRWLVSGRRSNLDQVAEAVNSDFGEPRYYDAFTRLEFDLSPETRMSASYLGSRDHIRAQRSSKSETSLNEYRNNYGWMTLEHDWSDRASTRIIAAFSDVTNERSGRVDRPGEIVGSVDDERGFHVASLQIEGRHEGQRFLSTWGLSAKRLSGAYDYRSNVRISADYPFPGSAATETQRDTQLDPSGNELSAFWTTRLQLLPQLTAELGVRWDDESYTEVDGPTQLAPRLSAMYLFPSGDRLRLSWGRYFQSQSINEAVVENVSTFFYPAQRADPIVASYESDFIADMQLRIEAYRKDYRSLRPRWENLFDPIVLVPELEYDRVFIDPDRARAEGIELFLSRRTQGEWKWWLAYSWSQVKDVIDGREFSRSWNQRHAVTAGLHWQRGRWDVTIADTYHTGWPTTPVFVEGMGADEHVVIGERNSVRLDDFNSLDVRVNRSFALPRGELDVFLEISNLLNESNACCVEPSALSTSNGTIELDAETTYWLGRVPSIGVLWRY